MSSDPRRLLVALDHSEPGQALKIVESLAPLGVGFKVGLQLFMAGGRSLVKELAANHKIFLDLKFHDIPNTVAAAVREAAGLGIWMLNVHASGGREMMRAAAAAASEFSPAPLVMAVTVLTSLDNKDLTETGCSDTTGSQVLRFSRLAANCGLDGVVCSAHEIRDIKNALFPRFITVTPGIRPAGSGQDDQVRTALPSTVTSQGGDYLVVGRPITAAADPLQTAGCILSEMGGDL